MPRTDRPNILFILTDQQSATMMSCAGNGHLRTPAMDSIAAHGVRFERAYCTDPVCVPSRFSLLTGRMPSEIALRSNDSSHLDEVPAHIREQGLGWLMRSAGYQVAYGGKEHLPKMRAADLGFDYICNDQRDGLATTCADFVSQRRNEPFFLFASFINPHDICYMAIRDWAVGEKHERLLARGTTELATLDEALRIPEGLTREEFFQRLCPPLPPNLEPPEDEPEAIRRMCASSPFRGRAREGWTDEQWRMHRWAYARLTERVDRRIGQVLDALRGGPNADDTLVIFTSDHGDMDSAHRLEHKGVHYEEACRIPLLIADPSVSCAGDDNAHLVSNGLDLLPTLCDYAGIAPPTDLQGLSLRPLIQGRPSGKWRNHVPVEFGSGRALVADRFKYALYDEGDHRELLIDRGTDPGEMHNRIDDPSCAEILARMRSHLWSELS